MAKPGREFEQAVCAFAQALDPSAEVLFNHSVPDRDTGTPRQCDVWINAKFGGHWPLSVLVSCKDRRQSGRKLHIGDIGTFCDEVRSTNANMGVIYCNVGFAKSAVEKAKANGITCCLLYQNDPACIPESIWFNQFGCKPSVWLILETDLRGSKIGTWNDLFDVEIDTADGTQTILDVISAAFARGETMACAEAKESGSLPRDWRAGLAFGIDEICEEVRIQVWGRWRRYRARLEATLLEGSYCLTDGSFAGSQTGPRIQVRSGHFGRSWTEIADGDCALPANRIVVILYGGDVATALRKEFGPIPL